MRQRRYVAQQVPPPELGVAPEPAVASSEVKKMSWRIQCGYNQLFHGYKSHDWPKEVSNPLQIDLASERFHLLTLVFGSLAIGYERMAMDPAKDSRWIYMCGFGVIDPTSPEGRHELQVLTSAWRLGVIQQKDILYTLGGTSLPLHSKN